MNLGYFVRESMVHSSQQGLFVIYQWNSYSNWTFIVLNLQCRVGFAISWDKSYTSYLLVYDTILTLFWKKIAIFID